MSDKEDALYEKYGDEQREQLVSIIGRREDEIERLQASSARLRAENIRLDNAAKQADADSLSLNKKTVRLQAIVDKLVRTTDEKVVTVGEQYYLICEQKEPTP